LRWGGDNFACKVFARSSGQYLDDLIANLDLLVEPLLAGKSVQCLADQVAEVIRQRGMAVSSIQRLQLGLPQLNPDLG
jgi:hypothetical protein